VNPLQAVGSVLAAAPDALYVSSLGTATSALRAASDDGPHLYMGGAMGSALAAAIGVADKATERDVLADGHYSITGGQGIGVPSAFAAVADALDLHADVVEAEDEIAECVRSLPRPALLEIRFDERDWPGPSPFVDPPVVRWRFEAAALTRMP
jgi:thiamine pyrophosphate-dependent acetolactate synthase large subunit-like protein